MRTSWLWQQSDSARPGRPGYGLLYALLLLCALPGALFAANVSATIDRDTVSIGDAATLTITCQGGSPSAAPTLPNVAGLRVQNVGQSTQFTYNNGAMNSSVVYSYLLAPGQAGDFTLPTFDIQIGGETFHTPAFTIKGVRNNAQPDSAQAEQQLALTKLIPPNRPVYVGEVFPLEMQVYVHDGIQGISGFQKSQLTGEGFTFGSKAVQGQQSATQIGSAKFTVFPIVTTASPVKAGELTINPVDCTMVLDMPGRRRQADPFDPFGVMNRNEQQRVTISTEAIKLQVLPEPDNAPPDYNGAVGNYTLSVSAAPTNVAAGDPVTVKIQITGRGAIDNLTLPVQSTWQDFKVYPPTSKVQITDQLGMQGNKSFELVVVPQSPEVRELPPVTFSFFDPEAKAYRTVTQAPIKLAVRAGAGGSNTLLAAAPAKPDAPAQDIVPIRQRLGPAQSTGPVLIQRPAFWAVPVAPALAWMALLVRRKKAESLANNPRLRRQRAVAATVASGLEDLRRLAAENDSDNFFATLFRLLQEQLGERLDVPASSITESVIDDHLRPLGVPAPTLQRIEDLFQACNQARYAPVKTSQELEAFIPRLESTLREIQEVNT